MCGLNSGRLRRGPPPMCPRWGCFYTAATFGSFISNCSADINSQEYSALIEQSQPYEWMASLEMASISHCWLTEQRVYCMKCIVLYWNQKFTYRNTFATKTISQLTELRCCNTYSTF
jgi:hypothetical protein